MSKDIGTETYYDRARFGDDPGTGRPEKARADAPNQFEAAARERKVAAMARAYWDLALITMDKFTEKEWRQLAERAGVNVASPETKAQVLAMLRSMRPTQEWSGK